MPNLFSINYLKQLCAEYHFTPSKKYGQNFLINPAPITRMVEAAEISKEDTVVEIGPGFGILTFALAEKAGKVLAFEIEKKLESYWNKKIEHYKNIEIVWGNVLKSSKFQNSKFKKYKVVANLPYQITSNAIRVFLEAENKPEIIVLMIQKEVAERICAGPGKMSILSVSVQYYAEPEIVMKAPRSYFWPEPGVDSAVLKLKVCKNRDTDVENFFRMVKTGFANKRKMLIKNLESLVGKDGKEKLKNAFKQTGLDEKIRAQDLSVEDWVGLSIKIFNF
ncbi:MAG: 16S rRNA (adenine(1518)-N(6)/adenine(1519)-N(6))-dimethyltransferase RsmA [Patescibacteria group bacterium]|nr:16S rRNA (adenine(1518)-N(6)/adenine(1519)-N(6))-dimethyltransferase RsmA [Patescibacteria group bacterium]